MSSQNRNIREIQKLIDEMGLKDRSVVGRTSKSICIDIQGVRGTRRVFAACTPSDWRNKKNMKRDVKRIAIEVGALPA